ncbi:hypothetical protein F2P81_012143 [Scophthalmus maximus]|uniref:Uncharacterized protein n=1 Tax=Scophthalmus maximus TaxID=52904 RepID=A0A6A4SP80_SCOMX|nr:hypothetical protein F2P81_012143 [Scophthalmus maximus]
MTSRWRADSPEDERVSLTKTNSERFCGDGDAATHLQRADLRLPGNLTDETTATFQRKCSRVAVTPSSLSCQENKRRPIDICLFMLP